MADTHLCIICKKTRAGRFTRPASGKSGAWTKGSLPAWYCTGCLPPGQGRGESEDAVIDVPSATPAKASTSTLLSSRREGVGLLQPLQTEVSALGTIDTEEEYLAADAVFGRVKAARKTWKLKMYGTKDKPGPIPAIKSGLDQLYALNREVDGPLAKMEETVELGMKAFKLAEFKRIQQAEDDKRQAEEEERAHIQELEEKAAALKTPAAKARVEQQIEEAAARLDEAQQLETPEKTIGANSSSRPKQVPTVTDITKFIEGVAEGTIPEDCLTVNMVKVRAYFKDDPDAVRMFPGVTIEDDIEIRGR